jgi:hypothetical protein
MSYESPNLTDKEANDLNLIKIMRPQNPTARIHDLPFKNQKYAIITYFPARGATANEEDMMAYFKIRGTFATEQEAQDRAIEIVKHQDQVLENRIVPVGALFPISTKKLSKDKTVEVVPEDRQYKEQFEEMSKKLKEEEAKAKKLQEDKIRVLKEESEKEYDDFESYVDLKNNIGTACSVIPKLIADINFWVNRLGTLKANIDKLDSTNPDWKNLWFDRLMDKLFIKPGQSKDMDRLIGQHMDNCENYEQKTRVVVDYVNKISIQEFLDNVKSLDDKEQEFKDNVYDYYSSKEGRDLISNNITKIKQ